MRYQIETCLSVEDYDGDFDDCQDDTRQAMDDVKDMVRETVGSDELYRQCEFVSCEFYEFDSGNPSHAAGYFHVDVEAPENVVEILKAEFDCT